MLIVKFCAVFAGVAFLAIGIINTVLAHIPKASAMDTIILVPELNLILGALLIAGGSLIKGR
jgi:hypothetical protein